MGVSNDFFNSCSELGACLPDVLLQHFVALSRDGNIQGLNAVVRLTLSINLDAENKRN